MRLVSAGFLLALLLTPKLWLSTRMYPLIPVAEWQPPIGPPFDRLVYGALIALTAAIALAPRRRSLLVACVAVYFVYSLWDQQRWVPFFNEIAALLVVAACYPWRGDPRGEKAGELLASAGLVACLIYLWSGIQKLNPEFYTLVYPWMVQPFTGWAPTAFAAFGPYLARSVPIVEMSLAPLLLIPKTRVLGITLAIAMHLFIIASVGPWGHDGNSQVWFWNFASIGIVLLVFARNEATFDELVMQPRHWVHKAVAVFFGIMPIFNFIELPWLGRWDDFQAATLYSGNHSKAEIYLSDADFARSPTDLQAITYEDHDGRNFFLVRDWAYKELNVPDYHAFRVHKKVGQAYCRLLGNSPTIVFRTREKQGLYRERPWREMSCKEL